MDVELIIFDCDGVLVDSEPLTTQLIADHARRLGLEMDVDDALARFKGGRLADVIAYVEAELGITVPETFIPDFRRDLAELLGREVEPVPGILKALERMPWPACVASNGPMVKMDASLGRVGLCERFAGRIYSAYDVGIFKPDPGLFLFAAQQHEASPAGCVVVEDSVGGVTAGVAAGMHVLAYDPEGEGGAMAEAGGTLFADMHTLPELVAAL